MDISFYTQKDAHPAVQPTVSTTEDINATYGFF